MRYFWITLGIAALHRLAVFVLMFWWIGLKAMADGGPVRWEGNYVIAGAYLLDFPLVLVALLEAKIQTGSFLIKHISDIGLFAQPWYIHMAWSLCVGLCVSVPLYLRHKKKCGH